MLQPAGTIRIVSRLVARAETLAELRALLSALVGPSRAESGCVSFDLLQGRVEPTEFALVAEWKDEAALTKHIGSDHLRGVMSRLADLTASSPEIITYTAIA